MPCAIHPFQQKDAGDRLQPLRKLREAEIDTRDELEHEDDRDDDGRRARAASGSPLSSRPAGRVATLMTVMSRSSEGRRPPRPRCRLTVDGRCLRGPDARPPGLARSCACSSRRHPVASARSERVTRLHRSHRSCQCRSACPGDHADTVAQTGGLVEVVGCQQEGRFILFQALDQLPELASCLGVEAGGRFVQDQQLGATDDPSATSTLRRWPPDNWRISVFCFSTSPIAAITTSTSREQGRRMSRRDGCRSRRHRGQ